ncbi:MAG: DUF4097 family beta strand repeat-containing protein [Melioribacteraceae bacterium]
MKKFAVIILLGILGLIFIAAVPASASLFKNKACNSEKYLSTGDKEIKKEFKVNSGGKVTIDLKTGADIEIKGWNKDLLSVVASIEDDKDNPIEFEFNQSGNNVEITSKYTHKNKHNHSSAKLTLQVPQKYNIDFTTMGGDVDIKSVEGELEGKTMGGALILSNLKGNLNLTTMGGEISLKNSEVDGSVKTMGGEVLVENVKGDVNASSMGGKVRQINVEGKNKSIGKEVNISTMGGELEIDKAPNGAKLRTMGGDINVNSVGKFLDAETMGGNIEAKEVDGWIKAKTMGGDVNVKMVGNPKDGNRDVKLTSMGGDITLVVPSGLSMEIDVEIAYTKNSHKNFEDCKIVSDFKIDEQRTTEWERKNGNSERKYVYGKGSVDGGKNKILIKTINGNVYLKKS